MANSSSNTIACNNIGSSLDRLSCCYANNQSDPTCEVFFSQQNGTLQNGCLNNDCVTDCQNRSLLYTSLLQTDLAGSGQGPIARYKACVNVPAIARYKSQGLLSDNISSTVQQYISPNITDDSLRNITSVVTDCLSSTCRNSRNSGFCYDDYCSPVKLLSNDTSPNIQAINTCLYKLCNGGYKALPYADPDVIGIGVFASYLLQCIFIVVLWFGFLVSAIGRFRARKGARRLAIPQPGNQQSSWLDLLLDFHKAQCYFSGTLMIASLAYGIYETNMLITFMLLPLATNGVLPVVFAYLLLVYYEGSSLGVTLLIIIVYVLSTLVYWSLYAHLIPLSSKMSQYEVYQQFMYKLSAIPACGGYSALAVCATDMKLGINPVKTASNKLRVLTPLIWTFSTIVLLALLGFQLHQWRSRPRDNATSTSPEPSEPQKASYERKESPIRHVAFWITTLAFLAGIGMQLSLLSIGKSLNMMDTSNWTFGQIVAVTIWIPPLLEYFYIEIKERVNKMKNSGVEKKENEDVRHTEKS